MYTLVSYSQVYIHVYACVYYGLTNRRRDCWKQAQQAAHRFQKLPRKAPKVREGSPQVPDWALVGQALVVSWTKLLQILYSCNSIENQ